MTSIRIKILNSLVIAALLSAPVLFSQKYSSLSGATIARSNAKPVNPLQAKPMTPAESSVSKKTSRPAAPSVPSATSKGHRSIRS